MFAAYGSRSLYTSICFLRLCPFLTQKVPLSTFRDFHDKYSRWSPLRITKPTRKINYLNLINLTAKYTTPSVQSAQSRPSRDEKKLNKRIISLKTVEEQLKLFESNKNAADIVNRVTVLVNVTKIVERNRKQQQVLQQKREKAQQGQSSTYLELLELISKDISECQPRHLANIMWALGKIKERDHNLVQVCEKEILSRGIVAFNSAGICQIVNGCTNLNLTSSSIFPKLQDAIIDGRIKIQESDNTELAGILLSFTKMENCSVALLSVFLEEILSRDLSKIGSREMAAFVWSFAKNKLVVDDLFYRVEKEIIRRRTNDFINANFVQVLWAFGTAGKGSKELFSFLDSELFSRGVKKFDSDGLLQIVWSFTRRNVTKAKVFDAVKKEIFNRGLHAFQTHELVLIFWSFVSAKRHDEELVAEVEGELCFRDTKQFDTGHLCQAAWSLGKAEKSDSKMFDVIEAEVLQRGASELSIKQKFMLMRGFIEAKKGNEDFYKFLVGSFSANDFRDLNCVAICESVWCFSRVGVDAESLFDALEKEILAKEKSYFSQKQLHFIRYSFQKVGKGSKELFEL